MVASHTNVVLSPAVNNCVCLERCLVHETQAALLATKLVSDVSRHMVGQSSLGDETLATLLARQAREAALTNALQAREA